MRIWATAAAAILLATALIGCGMNEVKAPSGPVVHHQDSTKRMDADSDFDLVISKFKWRYLAGSKQIKVSGEAVNRGEEAVRGVRIIVDVIDQFDNKLGRAETFLMPSYIKPGGTAVFDFYVPEGKWAENLQLHYSFESRQ